MTYDYVETVFDEASRNDPGITSINLCRVEKSRNLEFMRGNDHITDLYLFETDVSNLDALRGNTTLRQLALEVNHLTNIDGLENMTSLVYLSLIDNEITDIRPISTLTNLRTLLFDVNPFCSDDIIHLQNLTRLKSLDLRDAKSLDLLAIKPLLRNLESLCLKKCNLTTEMITEMMDDMDIAIPLTELNLEDNPIAGVGFINAILCLTHFYVSDCNISDLTPLARNRTIEVIEISRNPISSVECLRMNTTLREVIAFGCDIDLSPLFQNPSLHLLFSDSVKGIEHAFSHTFIEKMCSLPFRHPLQRQLSIHLNFNQLNSTNRSISLFDLVNKN